MANPRKFSEKIALHNQKQAEETAAFERIMQEVSVTRVIQPTQRHLNPHPPFLRPYLGGSLPNVNQMSGPPMEMPARPGIYDEMKQHHHLRHQPRFLPYTNRRTAMPPDFQNRHHRHLEGNPGGPYSGPYLSPPADTSWRRTNSDSALHQSVMNPNAQDFNNPGAHVTSMLPPPRRDLGNMNVPHKMVMDPEKLQQQLLAGANRPKSCEDSQMNILTNSDCHDVNRVGTNSVLRQGIPPNPTNAPGLSHVTQIGNNTGSLPDLTNLHIPSPLSNPIDYDGPQKQLPQHTNQQHGNNSLQSPASMLYNQARSTGNLNAASAIDPRLGGVPSPKLAGIKPDLKSPPIGGPYPYAYPLPGPGMQSGLDGRVPSHMQRQLQQQIQQQQQQHSQGSAHPVLRVDVNAASKVGQYTNTHMSHQMGPQRHSSSGNNMTSPITSPTSPTSRGSLSPGASPQHLPELTSTSNPALSEAYYRNDPSSMQPLQHQFEQFHVVNDVGSTAGMPHTSMPPPVYSSLQMLGDSGFMHSTTYGGQQRTSDSSIYTYNNGSNSLLYKNLMSPTSKIPDIVFTGVDDPHSSKLLGGSGMDLGYSNSGINTSGVTDFGADYFPGDDLKVNLGLEELQMLEEPNIIEDPSMEDDLHLNS